MPSTFSRSYTAGLAALLSAGGALALLLLGERPAGIGVVEPVGLIVAAVLFVASWRIPVLAVAGIVVVAVLGFLALAGGSSSVVIFEAGAVVCGVLAVVQAPRKVG